MTAGRGRIVAGVDGSDSSRGALRWAIKQAKLTGASVDAVMAWSLSTAFPPTAHTDIDMEGQTKSALAEIVSEVGGPQPDAPVRQVVGQGHAAEVLIGEAKGADLLVVGSRGRGGFTSAIVGSVSMHCVLNAHCPVLVLRDGHEGHAQP